MNTEGLWRGFMETGDPVCYLLAKKLEQPRRNGSQKKPARTGETPRPSG